MATLTYTENVTVRGTICGGCESAVENSLRGVEGVTAATADRETDTATADRETDTATADRETDATTADCDSAVDELVAAVETAGDDASA